MIVVDIIGKIEEIRLKFGKKLENFLLLCCLSAQKYIIKNFRVFLSLRNFAFFSCLFFVGLSIYVRSTRDIGYESLVYINLAQDFLLSGGVPSLVVFLTSIPVFLANFLGINPIIIVAFFVDLAAIFSLYFCYRLARKNDFIVRKVDRFYSCWKGVLPDIDRKVSVSDHMQMNFLLIGACFVYFLRIYALQYGEYSSWSSWLLIFSLPYIFCCLFSSKMRYVLALLIVAVKPSFVFLVLFFEISLQKTWKDWVFVGFLLIFTGLLWEGVQFDPVLLLEVLRCDVFPTLFMLILFRRALLEDRLLQGLFFAALMVQLAVIFGFDYSFEARSLIFSFAFLPLLAGCFSFIKIDVKIWGLILLLLILPQFDAQNFFNLLLNFCYFWWVFLFFSKKVDSFAIFLGLFSVFLIFLDSAGEASWLFCAFMMIYYFKDSFWAKILLFSYFLSLFLAGIFNHQDLYAAYLKTPNDLVRQKLELTREYAPLEGDGVGVIPETEDSSILLYLGKKSVQKNAKLIFIKKNRYMDNACGAGFLQKYLKNKKDFVKNYEFLTEIAQIKEIDRLSDFSKQGIGEVTLKKALVKFNEFEVYVRRGKK